MDSFPPMQPTEDYYHPFLYIAVHNVHKYTNKKPSVLACFPCPTIDGASIALNQEKEQERKVSLQKIKLVLLFATEQFLNKLY